VTSVGKGDEEFLFVVTLERKGLRLAKEEFKLRMGPAIRVRVWCRVVENAQGGTRKPELIRETEKCRELETEVNKLLRPLGVEVGLERGRPVAAPDAWFDREGRFHPIVLKDGKKANSPTLNELLKNDERGRLMYSVRRDRTGQAFTYMEMKDAREGARLHLKTWLSKR
jgi:hypothetical protein